MDLEQFKAKIDDFIFFVRVEKNSSTHTTRAYASDLQQVVSFWQTIATKEVSPLPLTLEQILKRFVVALFYKKISKNSLARKFSTLRSFQHFLALKGIALQLDIKSPKLDKKLPATLSVDEIFYLLDTIKLEDLPTKYPYRDRAVFELTYATGVRCSELINITMQDIDMLNKKIRIKGKGNKQRMVLFGSKAASSLEQYCKLERALQLDPENKQNFLFLNRNGTQITTRSVQRIFAMFRKFLNIERKLTPHKIRHSFATHLLQQGVNLRIIQELLGHKTINSTEIYTHVSSEQLAKMCDTKHPLSRLEHLIEKEKNAS